MWDTHQLAHCTSRVGSYFIQACLLLGRDDRCRIIHKPWAEKHPLLTPNHSRRLFQITPSSPEIARVDYIKTRPPRPKLLAPTISKHALLARNRSCPLFQNTPSSQFPIHTSWAPNHLLPGSSYRHPGNGGPQTCLPAAHGVAPSAALYGPSSPANTQDPREGPSLARRTMQDLLGGGLTRLAREGRRDQGRGHLARFL